MMKTSSINFNGWLAVNKPRGITSHDAVDVVRSTLISHMFPNDPKKSNSKTPWKLLKCGHGGTLDPMASGVLVMGIGSATKSLQGFLQGDQCRKSYIAEGLIGVATDTYDAEGVVTDFTSDMSSLDIMTDTQIKTILDEQFTGDIIQIPPIFSALRVKGKRMHEIARDNSLENPEIPARPVTVHSIALMSFEPNKLVLKDGSLSTGLKADLIETGVKFKIDVTCGGGTYIRSIIHDLGIALGSHAHMTSLIRSQQGPFVTSDQPVCVSSDSLKWSNSDELAIPVLELDQLKDLELVRWYMEKSPWIGKLQEYTDAGDAAQKIKSQLQKLEAKRKRDE